MRIFLVTSQVRDFEDVFQMVTQAAEYNGHSIVRIDHMFSVGNSTEQIQKEIQKSDLVIADISGRNANVMFELGFAISSNVPVLPISQRGESTPFEIQTFKTIIYDRERLIDTLFRPLRSFLAHKDFNKFFAEEIQTPSKKPQKTVFVSYSHSDIDYLNRLKVHLKPFEKAGLIDLWSDTKIKAGEKWKEKIEKALDKSVIAILLISADFLASDFIIDNELPPLLKSAEEKGKLILPVILKPCRFVRDPNLSKFQAINNPSTPLSKLDENGREEIYVEITNYIDDLIQ